MSDVDEQLAELGMRCNIPQHKEELTRLRKENEVLKKKLSLDLVIVAEENSRLREENEALKGFSRLASVADERDQLRDKLERCAACLEYAEIAFRKIRDGSMFTPQSEARALADQIRKLQHDRKDRGEG